MFIQTSIFQHFDIKYYMYIKINRLSYIINKVFIEPMLDN